MPENDPSVNRWRWTMTGTAPSKGTIVRGAEESGVVDADGAGEAIEQVLRHGWWDSFDQDQPVTLTVEPDA
jgi:hypothetical protein